jgi:archaellum component FlaG (FlaF/FlaG flagellin family)
MQSTPYAFTVYGTGFSMLTGFIPDVTDIINPNVLWISDPNYPPVLNTQVQPNTLTFYQTETGSTPNTTGTITITVTLSGHSACIGSWTVPNIKYA